MDSLNYDSSKSLDNNRKIESVKHYARIGLLLVGKLLTKGLLLGDLPLTMKGLAKMG